MKGEQMLAFIVVDLGVRTHGETTLALVDVSEANRRGTGLHHRIIWRGSSQ